MKAGQKISLLRFSTVMLVLLILLAVLCLLSIAVGSAGYSILEILDAVFREEKSPIKTIVVNLRLPRVILAILIGASLAAAGALLQSVMRNPKPHCLRAAFCLWRRGAGLCADLHHGLERRGGPYPDYPVRRGH